MAHRRDQLHSQARRCHHDGCGATLLILALGRRSQWSSKGQPGLHSKIQAIQSYLVRLSQRTGKRRKRRRRKKSSCYHCCLAWWYRPVIPEAGRWDRRTSSRRSKATWESEVSLSYLKSCLQATEAKTSDKKKHLNRCMSEKARMHARTHACALSAHSGPNPGCLCHWVIQATASLL